MFCDGDLNSYQINDFFLHNQAALHPHCLCVSPFLPLSLSPSMYLSPTFLWFTQAQRRAAGWDGEREGGEMKKVWRGGNAKGSRGREEGGM